MAIVENFNQMPPACLSRVLEAMCNYPPRPVFLLTAGPLLMMFIFRAIFWLAVVSAILPPREGEPGTGEAAGRMVGAAMDYCAVQPVECLAGARATAEAARIPAEFILRASNLAASQAMPQPKPRPTAY